MAFSHGGAGAPAHCGQTASKVSLKPPQTEQRDFSGKKFAENVPETLLRQFQKSKIQKGYGEIRIDTVDYRKDRKTNIVCVQFY
jgi:hypothetical protein